MELLESDRSDRRRMREILGINAAGIEVILRATR
jgi:hypothetical protein